MKRDWKGSRGQILNGLQSDVNEFKIYPQADSGVIKGFKQRNNYIALFWKDHSGCSMENLKGQDQRQEIS